TEEQTRELEPDERTWSREYAAEPSSVVSAAWDPADLASCYGRTPAGTRRAGFISSDASSLRGDGWVYLGGYDTTATQLVVLEASGWEGEALRHVSMSGIVEHVAARARAWGTSTVFGDQREEASLTALFAKERITFRSFAWSEPSKDVAVQRLRTMMR